MEPDKLYFARDNDGELWVFFNEKPVWSSSTKGWVTGNIFTEATKVSDDMLPLLEPGQYLEFVLSNRSCRKD